VDAEPVERDVAADGEARRAKDDVGERAHHPCERDPHDEGDRQIDQVAARDELPELLDHRTPSLGPFPKE
jgi:hypothetical protein